PSTHTLSRTILSIVIPIYRQEFVIERCLESIYKQNLNEESFEVICIDDQSPDNVVNIVQEYSKTKGNLRIVFHEFNRGIGAVRNTGIKESRGLYLMYLDGDDEILSDSLLLIYNVLNNFQYSLDILHGGYTTNDSGEIYYYKNKSDVMTGTEYLCSQSIPSQSWPYIYRLEFLRQNGLLFREGVVFEDTDFVWKATFFAKKIKYINIVFYRYYINRNSASHGNWTKNKTISAMQMFDEMKDFALSIMVEDMKSCEAILNRAFFGYGVEIKRHIWNYSYKCREDIFRLYRPCPPQKNKTCLLNEFLVFKNYGLEQKLAYMVFRFPIFFNIFLTMIHPILSIVFKIKKISK
ncbi:glycosyltransferase, partial [Akkermansia sp. N21169]|uniref:glycosyltransferase family 2 protein n=1 Tax=Akkermansia sp. N21169 TaxID=3040765 RepID=UPI00244E9708